MNSVVASTVVHLGCTEVKSGGEEECETSEDEHIGSWLIRTGGGPGERLRRVSLFIPRRSDSLFSEKKHSVG